jgi:uncharacterized protein
MKRLFILLLTMAVTLFPLQAQEAWCPEPTNRLVNDYAGELSADEVEMLEQRLVAFNDSTSNQILVIITPTLHGGEIMDVGTRIGTKWGVGQKDLKNGLVILIKSKCDEEPYGDVALLPGYGLEGALPDAFCKHIIDDEMIDPLANGNYYKALTKALDVIEPVCRGEYSYKDYKRKENREALFGLLASLGIVVLVIVLMAWLAKKHGGKGTGGTPFIGGTPTGSFHGGSFGSSSRGFSSGGFGGFGGGSFGGGGAHGRF